MEDLEARTENNDKFKEELKKELKSKRIRNIFFDGTFAGGGLALLISYFLPNEYQNNPLVFYSTLFGSLVIGYTLAVYNNKPEMYEKRKDLQ